MHIIVYTFIIVYCEIKKYKKSNITGLKKVLKKSFIQNLGRKKHVGTIIQNSTLPNFDQLYCLNIHFFFFFIYLIRNFLNILLTT